MLTHCCSLSVERFLCVWTRGTFPLAWPSIEIRIHLWLRSTHPYTLLARPLTCLWFWLAAFHTCEPTVFTCGNGRCVPYRYRCDHYDDCGDNSDEVGCLFRPCDPTTEFTCNNGRCIANDYVCNGINNCYDNDTSDEQNCRESTHTDYISLHCSAYRCRFCFFVRVFFHVSVHQDTLATFRDSHGTKTESSVGLWDRKNSMTFEPEQWSSWPMKVKMA